MALTAWATSHDMPVVTYWLQHIDSDAGYRVWREIQDYVKWSSASEGTSNPAPKKRAKAQASAAEGPPNPAPKKKAKAAASSSSKAPEIGSAIGGNCSAL